MKRGAPGWPALQLEYSQFCVATCGVNGWGGYGVLESSG